MAQIRGSKPVLMRMRGELLEAVIRMEIEIKQAVGELAALEAQRTVIDGLLDQLPDDIEIPGPLDLPRTFAPSEPEPF